MSGGGPDGRPAVALSLIAGFCVWRYEAPALAVPLAFLVWFLPRQPSFRSVGGPVLRPALRFAAFFAAIKFGLDMISAEADALQAAMNAGMLFGRLLAAVGIGLALLTFCGPRGLCLALTWYLRPLLGRRAWRVGLSGALVVRFLPMIFALVEQTARQIRLRAPHLGIVRRLALLSRAVLRQLAQKSWSQSVALLARDLARPEAWVTAGPPAAAPVLRALAASAVCIGLLYV